jgi:hypothetical protein
MTEAARLEKLFEKYKYTAPVNDAGRERLIESRERVFKSALKELELYSVWYAVILSVFFKLRNIGIKSSIAAAKAITVVSAITAGAIIAGGAITAYKYVYADSVAVEKNKINNTENINISNESFPLENDAIQKTDEKQTQIQSSGPLSEIQLYNGRIYRGIILSRGNSYVIHTSKGRITIPAKQIKTIRRVN